MDMNKLAEKLKVCKNELYTLIVQYGSACLLDDKTNASSFNNAIRESLNSLDKLILDVHKLEVEQITHEDILSDIAED